MSMKYEGEGIMLNIDRIVRMIFAEGLEGDVRTSTELQETGRTSVFIRLETLEDAPWQHYDLRSMRDLDRNGWVIFITDRSWRPPIGKLLPADLVVDADYTIEPLMQEDDESGSLSLTKVKILGMLPPTTGE